jgi:hypothetical protein
MALCAAPIGVADIYIGGCASKTSDRTNVNLRITRIYLCIIKIYRRCVFNIFLEGVYHIRTAAASSNTASLVVSDAMDNLL